MIQNEKQEPHITLESSHANESNFMNNQEDMLIITAGVDASVEGNAMSIAGEIRNNKDNDETQ